MTENSANDGGSGRDGGAAGGPGQPEDHDEPRGVEPVDASCPYCGVSLELLVDVSAGAQHYVEDCEVCCNPMEVRVVIDRDGDPMIDVRHQDD
ncbi:MAG: CPXCG motif-containing cysteine-rich protein [Gemmatimonadetes bacterium]|nr:CPXCG motif-containing cysteine-rich protein [Gemmatimonadota bacterium]